jgi:hypothetical protein
LGSICLGWLWTTSLLIFAFWVTGITGVSHQPQLFSVVRALCGLVNSSLAEPSFAVISPSLWLVSSLFWRRLHRAKVLHFNEAPLTNSFFHVLCLKYCKISSPNPRSSRILSWVIFCKFHSFCFIFRSVVHFKRFLFRLFFFPCGCPVVEHFVEKTVFALLYCLCPTVKDQWAEFVWVCFWAFHSLPLVCLFSCQCHTSWLLWPYNKS